MSDKTYNKHAPLTPMVRRSINRMSLSQLELLYVRWWQTEEWSLLKAYVGLCIAHRHAYKDGAYKYEVR